MDSRYLVQNAVDFLRNLPVKGIDETFALARFPLDRGYANYLVFARMTAKVLHLRKRPISDELVLPIVNLAGKVTPGLKVERFFSTLPIDAYNPVDHEDKTFSFYCQLRGRDENGTYISPAKRNGRPKLRAKNLVSAI